MLLLLILFFWGLVQSSLKYFLKECSTAEHTEVKIYNKIYLQDVREERFV